MDPSSTGVCNADISSAKDTPCFISEIRVPLFQQRAKPRTALLEVIAGNGNFVSTNQRVRGVQTARGHKHQSFIFGTKELDNSSFRIGPQVRDLVLGDDRSLPAPCAQLRVADVKLRPKRLVFPRADSCRLAFTASGLDIGYTFASVEAFKNLSYQ
jgi:hypothetical protein